MSFNYYHTNVVIPTLIMANRKFFLETILPSPTNMQTFIEKESFKIAIKSYNEEAVKPKVKNITANRIKGYFVVFVEFEDNFVLEDTDNFGIAIAINKDNLRFFTYEKGTNEETSDDTFIVGELELKDNNIGKHIKYGITSEYNISYFAGIIEDVI